jgi:hypothetical protein
MYIVHSNINQARLSSKKRTGSSFIQMMEHKQFLKACKKTKAKYAAQIAEIQKHFPGWEPVFKK